MHDLISDGRFLWHGDTNFVQLDPHVSPAHIFECAPDPDRAGFRLLYVTPVRLLTDVDCVILDRERIVHRPMIMLSDFDLQHIGEGTHDRLYEKLGAHVLNLDGRLGNAFRGLGPERTRDLGRG